MTTGTMPREDSAVPPLANVRVVVAGGTGKVGRELVSALISAGATTAVSSRSAAKLAVLRAHVAGSTSEAAAERLVTIDGDIADEADTSRVLALALERPCSGTATCSPARRSYPWPVRRRPTGRGSL